MKINDVKYALGVKNYHSEEHIKTKIVIGSTLTSNMKHYVGWIKRLNGMNKKTATFTIDLDGSVYNHFDPLFYSDFLKMEALDKESISILIVNEGWLDKVPDRNQYTDWFSRPYSRESDVFRKRWRHKEFWAPYTKEQFESCLSLCEYLCDRYNIKRNIVAHNTKLKRVKSYNGVLYRSNFKEELTDLNPSWDYNEFSNRLKYDE